MSQPFQQAFFQPTALLTQWYTPLVSLPPLPGLSSVGEAAFSLLFFPIMYIYLNSSLFLIVGISDVSEESSFSKKKAPGGRWSALM